MAYVVYLPIVAVILLAIDLHAETRRRIDKSRLVRHIIRDVETGTLKLKADVLSRLGELL